MKGKIRIAAAGDNCIDFYDDTREYYVGGNPVNVAVYIRRMGGEASYLGVVGNDENGELVIKGLSEKGVDCSHVKKLEGATAVTHIKIVGSERVFGKYEEGVLPKLKFSEKDLRFMAGHDIVVSGIWGYVDSYFKKLKEYGTVLAMDFSTELESEMIGRIGSYVDYAFFSFEKGYGGIKEYIKAVSRKIRGIVIVTRGEDGSIAYDGERFYEQGIKQCRVIDTMGAGDSFIAGFLYGMAAGRSIREAMELGADNSSVTIGYQGAW